MFPTLMLSLVLLGCDGSTSPPVAVPAATVNAKHYDPPVDPAVVPVGAWMCDMGTVHYADDEAGSCPVCGMALTQKKQAVR